MWLIHYCVKNPSNAALSFCFQLTLSRLSKPNNMDESFFAYAEVVNHSLATFATYDVGANTVSDIHLFTEAKSITATVY